MKLPKVVYVRIEKYGDGPYLVAEEKPEGEHGEKVGVYRLVSVKKRKIVESLV